MRQTQICWVQFTVTYNENSTIYLTRILNYRFISTNVLRDVLVLKLECFALTRELKPTRFKTILISKIILLLLLLLYNPRYYFDGRYVTLPEKIGVLLHFFSFCSDTIRSHNGVRASCIYKL